MPGRRSHGIEVHFGGSRWGLQWNNNPGGSSHLPVIVPLPLAHHTPSEGSELPALNHRRAAANIQRCSRAPETCGDTKKKTCSLYQLLFYSRRVDVHLPAKTMFPPQSKPPWSGLIQGKNGTEDGLNVLYVLFLCVSAEVCLSSICSWYNARY